MQSRKSISGIHLPPPTTTHHHNWLSPTQQFSMTVHCTYNNPNRLKCVCVCAMHTVHTVNPTHVQSLHWYRSRHSSSCREKVNKITAVNFPFNFFFRVRRQNCETQLLMKEKWWGSFTAVIEKGNEKDKQMAAGGLIKKRRFNSQRPAVTLRKNGKHVRLELSLYK